MKFKSLCCLFLISLFSSCQSKYDDVNDKKVHTSRHSTSDTFSIEKRNIYNSLQGEWKLEFCNVDTCIQDIPNNICVIKNHNIYYFDQNTNNVSKYHLILTKTFTNKFGTSDTARDKEWFFLEVDWNYEDTFANYLLGYNNTSFSLMNYIVANQITTYEKLK